MIQQLLAKHIATLDLLCRIKELMHNAYNTDELRKHEIDNDNNEVSMLFSFSNSDHQPSVLNELIANVCSLKMLAPLKKN